MISNTYNMDCMEALRGFPDKFFDLAVVDPPYGSGGGGVPNMENGSEDGLTATRVSRTGGKWAKKYGKK